MSDDERVSILLVDDQPGKLLSYQTILEDLGETLITAGSATEALEQLLGHDVAVVLVDVCMPDLDGFELAAMIREHPRYQKTSILFVSAVHLTELDRLRGYECGAVDYIPVPIVPEILRAKVAVFAELYRKTRQLERLNGSSRAASATAPRSSKPRPPACARARSSCARPTAARTSSWPCWRTSCATRWRRSAPRCS